MIPINNYVNEAFKLKDNTSVSSVFDKIKNIVKHYNIDKDKKDDIDNNLPFIEMECKYCKQIKGLSKKQLRDKIIDSICLQCAIVCGLDEDDEKFEDFSMLIEDKLRENKVFNDIIRKINNDAIVLYRNEHVDEFVDDTEEKHYYLFDNMWANNKIISSNIQDIYGDEEFDDLKNEEYCGDSDVSFFNFHDKIFIINCGGDSEYYSEMIYIIVNKK